MINRVRPRNSEHEFRIAELRELFGPLVFSNVLPDRSAIQQAQGACLPIQRWDTPGAREVSAVFTTLLGRVLRTSRPRRGSEQHDGLHHDLDQDAPDHDLEQRPRSDLDSEPDRDADDVTDLRNAAAR